MEVTVKSCVKARDWVAPDGKIVQFYDVELTDGTKGSVTAKEIPIGTSINDLEITSTEKGNKIKLKKAGFGGGGFKGGGSPKGNESFAMSYAKDLVVADKVKIEQLIPTADKIYDWLEAKKK